MKLWHIGHPSSGARCTSRRTGFVKKYAIPSAEFATKDESQRCKRCQELFLALRKKGIIK